MSKQIRVSDAIYDEINRLVKEYDADRKSLLNTALTIMRCIIENDAKSIEFVNDSSDKISMPVPILFKKK